MQWMESAGRHFIQTTVETSRHIPKNRLGLFGVNPPKTHTKLNPTLLSFPLVMKNFITTEFIKLLKLQICKFLYIYFTHSRYRTMLILTKSHRNHKPIKIWKPGFNSPPPKKNSKPTTPSLFKTIWLIQLRQLLCLRQHVTITRHTRKQNSWKWKCVIGQFTELRKVTNARIT